MKFESESKEGFFFLNFKRIHSHFAFLTVRIVINPAKTQQLYYSQLHPWLISNLMHKIPIYLHIIHLLKSSTCFEHYPAHLHV